jgi:hypothetical protein
MAFGYVFEGYRFAGVALESKALTSQRTPNGSDLWSAPTCRSFGFKPGRLMAMRYVFEGYCFSGVALESKSLTSQRTPKGERFMECSDLSELWVNLLY